MKSNKIKVPSSSNTSCNIYEKLNYYRKNIVAYDFKSQTLESKDVQNYMKFKLSQLKNYSWNVVESRC